MMRTFSTGRFITATIISLFLFAGISSCKKDDALAVPRIVDSGMVNGKDSITVGEALLIHPILNARLATIYQWKINKEAAGADSVLNFMPPTAGDYTIDFKAVNSSGEVSFQYAIHVWGKYENGIFLVNEGWFGTENGSANFYRYGRDTVEQMVFHKENPGKDLGVTTQFAAVHDKKLYLVSKQGPFVVADAHSLKETGRIENLPADGRAFLGLDNNNGLISTSDGIYKLSLSPLSIGEKLSGISGETGSMRKEGDYIYVLNQEKGLLVLKQTDYSIVKEIEGMQQGITQTADGKIWVAGGSRLLHINPTNLDTASVELPFELGNPWFAWNVGTVTASSTENAVFIAKTMPWGAGGNEVYKYIPGNASSLAAPFATLPTGKEFYGAAVGYNRVKNELVVTSVQSGYGQNYKFNYLYLYDAASGNLKKAINYEHFYFPAMMVFN